MSGRDKEHGGSIGIGPPSSIGIGPPSSMSMPRGETATGTPERTFTGDPEAAPGRSRLWPPSESPTGPLGGRWLLPPRQLAAHEQQLLKEELGRLARNGDTAVAVAAGAATGEVFFVLPGPHRPAVGGRPGGSPPAVALPLAEADGRI